MYTNNLSAIEEGETSIEEQPKPRDVLGNNTDDCYDKNVSKSNPITSLIESSPFSKYSVSIS